MSLNKDDASAFGKILDEGTEKLSCASFPFKNAENISGQVLYPIIRRDIFSKSLISEIYHTAHSHKY